MLWPESNSVVCAKELHTSLLPDYQMFNACMFVILSMGLVGDWCCS